MRQAIFRECADAEFQRQVAGIIETVGEAAQALTAATTRLERRARLRCNAVQLGQLGLASSSIR